MTETLYSQAPHSQAPHSQDLYSQALHSHHWSAILATDPELQSWTETQFVDLVTQLVLQAGLTPISHTGFTFQVQGVSVVVLLEESHVALHYWPEKGKLSVDIHVCDYQQDNKPKAEKLAALLAQRLGRNPGKWRYLTVVE